jgi:hypothetical protein
MKNGQPPLELQETDAIQAQRRTDEEESPYETQY